MKIEAPDPAFVAIDLGAGSGRVVVGSFGDDALECKEVKRFPQQARFAGGHERWDFEALWSNVQSGLRAAADACDMTSVRSVGACGWGVDYGLLDADQTLIEDPVCYRDARTQGAIERWIERISPGEIYKRSGIQFMPINTSVQLFAQNRDREWPDRARRLAMLPDLVHLRACGVLRGEVTNASTTQLLNVWTRTWDEALLRSVHVNPNVMPPLVQPGTRLGSLCRDLGLPPWDVVCPATHDTASAVVGTPLEDGWAYLSSGTWSLLGVELEDPILDDRAMRSNFTNEAGYGGVVRFLKNVMGLWLLEQCRASWEREGRPLSREDLAKGLTDGEPGSVFVDPDDLRFLNPKDMAREITLSFERTRQPAIRDPLEVCKVVLESLALRYAEVVRELERVSGRRVRGVHVVGGGSRNRFLNQATAEATGLPVRAGPAEATSVGNLVAQAIAAGRFEGLADARAYLARVLPPETFEPKRAGAWTWARERFEVVVERARRG